MIPDFVRFRRIAASGHERTCRFAMSSLLPNLLQNSNVFANGVRPGVFAVAFFPLSVEGNCGSNASAPPPGLDWLGRPQSPQPKSKR
jgi:hypothetical protein